MVEKLCMFKLALYWTVKINLIKFFERPIGFQSFKREWIEAILYRQFMSQFFMLILYIDFSGSYAIRKIFTAVKLGWNCRILENLV